MPTFAALKDRAAMRQLITLAWPLVVSRATQVVIGFSDAAMAGRLGEDALAATTTGSMNTFSVLMLPMGIVFMVSSYASQFTGEQKPASARRYGWYGLVLAAFTAVVAAVCVPLVPLVVPMLGLSPAVQGPLTAYLQVRLWSAGPAVGMEAIGNYYGGIGNTSLPMRAGIIAMVSNVFFNWVLIFGNLGAPALGVVGAAWANNLATCLGFAYGMVCFWGGAGTSVDRIDTPLTMKEFRQLIRFGLPSGFNWFLEFAAFAFFINIIVGSLGTSALAAMMAVLELSRVAFMPAFGAASAGAIMSGQALGAQKADEVPAHVARTMALSTGWEGFCSIVFFLFPEQCLRLFVDPSQDVRALMEHGVPMLMMCCLWQVADAAATVFAETLRAAGDTTFCLWARIAMSWGIVVPGGWLHVRIAGGGSQAATFWFLVYLVALAAVLWWRFARGRWRTIGLTQQAAA